jgi:hypothetical protein
VSHLLHVLFLDFIKAVTFLFMLGVAGCVAVLVMTFREDLRTIAGYRE